MSKRHLSRVAILSPLVGCALLTGLHGCSDGETSERGTSGADAATGASPPVLTPGAGGVAVACQSSATCGADEACCVVYSDTQEDFCVPRADAGSCASQAVPTALATCDDDDDCAALGQPGTVCCGTPRSSVEFERIACVAPELCTGAGVRLCDGTKRGCPPGKTCQAGTLSAPLWECR
jgi:hypothetical protein